MLGTSASQRDPDTWFGARIGLFALITTLGLVLWTPEAGNAQYRQLQSGMVVEDIVASVDGNLILRSDVQTLVLQMMRQQRRTYSGQLWSDALEQLIQQQVLVIHAQRDTTLQVNEGRVDQVLNQRIDALASQVGGEDQLEQMYGKSILQIKNDYRSDIRERLLANQYIQSKIQEVHITPEEVTQWFNEIPKDSLPRIPRTVRVSHIVRYPQPSTTAKEQARQLAASLRDSILNGASFEQMAQRYSDDQASASDGGRYQNFNLNELVPEFGAVAGRLEPGEISQVFETDFGFHVMRLNRRVGDVVDFNHILIRVEDTNVDPSETKEFLRTLRDSVINRQATFARLAKRHSEDPSSSSRGGYVTSPRTGDRDIPVSELGELWRQTLDTLEVGEISGPAPVQMQDGRRAWHIVWLQKRTPSHIANLEQDYQRLQQIALQQKQQRKAQEWIRHLRQNVYIKLYKPEPPTQLYGVAAR